MISPIHDELFQLLAAQRVRQATDRILAKRAGRPDPEPESEKSARASTETIEVHPAARAAAEKIEAINIRLAELIQRLDAAKADPAQSADAPAAVPSTTITLTQTELSFRLKVYSKIDGMLLTGRHSTETDRYLFEFLDGATFRITDKWTGRSTTIWGDPHVDTSDEEGNMNGEFSDLAASDTHTSLMLQDGTRVTFTARDRGVIERVDVFHNGRHAWGLGAAAPAESNEPRAEFRMDGPETGADAARSLPLGDVVRAGGDGNDWFDSTGNLVWGAVTGPAVHTRPAAVLAVEYSKTELQVNVDRTM